MNYFVKGCKIVYKNIPCQPKKDQDWKGKGCVKQEQQLLVSKEMHKRLRKLNDPEMCKKMPHKKGGGGEA